jgi:hypothetical protein
MTNKERFSAIRQISNLELEIKNLRSRLNELMYFCMTPNNDDEDGLLTKELEFMFKNHESIDDELHLIQKAIPKAIKNIFEKEFGINEEPSNEDN